MSIILKVRGKGINVKIRYDDWLNSFDKKYSIKAGQPITTTLSGVKFNDCESVIKKNIKAGKLKAGTELMLITDPQNKYDRTATRVCNVDGWFMGWLPNQDWNDSIFNDLMKGKKWTANVKEVRKPDQEFSYTNIIVELWEYYEN